MVITVLTVWGAVFLGPCAGFRPPCMHSCTVCMRQCPHGPGPGLTPVAAAARPGGLGVVILLVWLWGVWGFWLLGF